MEEKLKQFLELKTDILKKANVRMPANSVALIVHNDIWRTIRRNGELILKYASSKREVTRSRGYTYESEISKIFPAEDITAFIYKGELFNYEVHVFLNKNKYTRE